MEPPNAPTHAGADPRPYLRERASAMLQIADGRSARQMARHGLYKPRKPETVCRWLAAIDAALALTRAQPEVVSLVYADAFILTRQPTLAAVWAAQGTEPVARLSQRRNTRWRISGALDAVTGRVTTHAAARMGVAELGRFLRRLRATYPDRRLILVWDTWPVHRHPAVLAVATELGIELLWLPTDAPWTNPIEKLWRWVKQAMLHHHRQADQWEALKDQVAAFLDQFADGSVALLRDVGLLPELDGAVTAVHGPTTL